MLRQVPLFALLLSTLTTGAVPPAAAQDARADLRLQLDSISRLSITRNLAVRRSREREHEADASIDQARGLFLPALAVDARYSALHGVVNIGDFINPAYAALNQLTGRNAFPTNISNTLPQAQETKLHTTLPLFNGALFANYAAARSIRSMRGAERGAAVRRLDADSRIAYLDWARSARAVQIWDATLPVLEENARVSQRLVNAGTATPDAVLRARASLADARQQRAEATRLRGAALGALNLLLDQQADAPVVLPDLADDEGMLPPAPNVALADALASSARRDEFAIVGAAIDAAHAQARSATSAFLPSVALAADWGLQGSSYRFDPGHTIAIGSVVLQWNLFNGGQDAARHEAATATREGARLQRAELNRQVALDVRTAWDAVQSAREALVAADARLAAARAAFTLVDRRYAEGLASHLEWSDARAQLTSAQLNQLLTRYSLAARGIDLERAAALRTLPLN